MHKLAIVSYHNTLPFIEAFKLNDVNNDFELIKSIPSDCARQFKSGEVDIALLPIGSLPTLPAHQIVTHHCIGSDGPVYSVCIMADKPIEQCKTILLDPDSMTSNLLAQLIVDQYFDNKLEITQVADGYTAHVLIGDKVFAKKEKFKYVYDLGAIWKLWQNLPFVFAVWVASPKVQPEVINQLTHLFDSYFDTEYLRPISNIELDAHINLHTYLSKFINYKYDVLKQEALIKFQLMTQYLTIV